MRGTTALRVALLIAVVGALAVFVGGTPWGPG
jgi:hypothetical protein